MEVEGGREGDQEGCQEMVEVEESEELQMVDTGTVKQWEVVFSRLQSINQESHLLMIDKVTPPLLPEVTLLPVPGGDPDPEPEQQHAVLLVAGRHGANQVTAAGHCRVSHCSAAGPRWRLCCRRQTLTGTVACPWQSSSTSGTPRRPWTSKLINKHFSMFLMD